MFSSEPVFGMFEMFGRTGPRILRGAILSAENLWDHEQKTLISHQLLYNVLMDQAIMSVDERFPQMTEFRQTFEFLFNIRTFKGINCDNSKVEELKKQCPSLQQV